LKVASDPNVYGAIPIATAEPSYGCSTAGTAALPMLLVALALVLSKRRRSAHPRR